MVVNPYYEEPKFLTVGSGANDVRFNLDEGAYFELLPVSYVPSLYGPHETWCGDAYYNVESIASLKNLKPETPYTFVFFALCKLYLDGDIGDIPNIGRVNCTITNNDTSEPIELWDLDCNLYGDGHCHNFVTQLSLPKWENITINFDIFSVEMRA